MSCTRSRERKQRRAETEKYRRERIGERGEIGERREIGERGEIGENDKYRERGDTRIRIRRNRGEIGEREEKLGEIVEKKNRRDR